MEGYIKVYRKVMCNPVWQDPDLFRLWMYCLMKASHKERKVLVDKQEVQLEPGQFLTGRFSLQQEFNQGIPPRKQAKDTTLWSWLKKLEKMGNLDIKSFNKYSVISILHWSEYQETLTTESQQIDSKVTTESQQIDTNKNVKNVNNDKNDKKKNIYADFVSMTSEEYEKLIEQFGQAGTDDRIERLNLYKGSKGVKYKNDYLTILNWERKNNKGGAVVGANKNTESLAEELNLGF